MTLIAVGWASSIGIIDTQGAFQGAIGVRLNSFLKFMLDLNADIAIFSSILTIILLPQFVSYGMSGLFGSASAPLFVGATIRFFIWSIVKSLLVVAGIVLAFAFYGYFSHWDGWSAKGSASMASLSGLLLMLSFSILYVYRDVHAAVETPLTTNRSLKLKKILICSRRWMTRNMRG